MKQSIIIELTLSDPPKLLINIESCDETDLGPAKEAANRLANAIGEAQSSETVSQPSQ